MLDIIIPRYNEPWEVGEKMFRILDLQRGVDFNDFRVFLIHDGTEPFPEERFSGLKYKVEQVTIQHGGVSAARNAGIDCATDEWIMFCDFDDTFAGLYSLRDILTVLGTRDQDVLWGQLVAEDLVEGHNFITFTPERQTWVFTHGKVYRRQFLVDSGIRFNEELNFNEDSEFNARIIARLPFQRIGKIKAQSPLYIWIRRPSSVTQSGREDEAAWGHFRRNLIITQENLEHRGFDCFCGMVTRTAWDTWFMIQSPHISNEMKRRIMERFVPWMRERRSAFMKVDADTLRQIREVARDDLVYEKEIVRDEPELVIAWVNEITKRSDSNGNTNN